MAEQSTRWKIQVMHPDDLLILTDRPFYYITPSLGFVPEKSRKEASLLVKEAFLKCLYSKQ